VLWSNGHVEGLRYILSWVQLCADEGHPYGTIRGRKWRTLKEMGR